MQLYIYIYLYNARGCVQISGEWQKLEATRFPEHRRWGEKAWDLIWYQFCWPVWLLNDVIWVFPKIGVPPNHQLKQGDPFKQSMFGYPYFWKHLYLRPHTLFVTHLLLFSHVSRACMAMMITSDISTQGTYEMDLFWSQSAMNIWIYMDLYRLISTSNHNTEMFVFPSLLWAAFYFEDTHASHICRSHGPDVSGGLPLAVTTLAGRYWGSTRDSHAQRF